MTINEAIETIQDMLDVLEAQGSAYVYKHNGGDIRLRNVLHFLRAQQKTEKNEPLTLDELREMDQNSPPICSLRRRMRCLSGEEFLR